jgi:hypothetical protein
MFFVFRETTRAEASVVFLFSFFFLLSLRIGCACATSVGTQHALLGKWVTDNLEAHQ